LGQDDGGPAARGLTGIKYAVEPMRKAGGGSSISTSSVASFLPSPHGATYAAAKGAVILGIN
jgi:short-subunit dehydrogenase